MAKSLLIVESPAKAKTIGRYLAEDFHVVASVGHLKDLPSKKLGVDVDDDFKPQYEIIPGKRKILTEIKKKASKASKIYLASDPDREGEAIAWHIAKELGWDKNVEIKGKQIFRVLVNEITKKAIKAAIADPCELDQNKFESQQARRILDRLVGYKLSPILWEKVKRGLSAGRVQSVCVRLVAEREAEIEKFISEEYWRIFATFEVAKGIFQTRLHKIEGKNPEIKNEKEALDIVSEAEKQKFIIKELVKKEWRRKPLPPFTTSKLQQEGARRLRFTAKKTMSLAQKLYEGIAIGEEEAQGLITYMRTDSVRVGDDAITAVREHITGAFGKEYVPEKPYKYVTKKKAQDAHEAIRPTSLDNTPEKVKPYLDKDDWRLYTLIWNRFVASQMNPAIYDRTTVDVEAGRYIFRASGAVLRFPGFTAVYEEQTDSDTPKDQKQGAQEESGTLLPDIAKGETPDLRSFDPKQFFTQPPPRYSEASLVKEMEERGIGRPSTYAAILGTIQDKGYSTKVAGRFHVTDLGRVVTELLVENFPDIMDIGFTAQMEELLDSIEEGKFNWIDTLKKFYVPFARDMATAKTNMRNLRKEVEETDISCPKCDQKMIIRWGKNGRFLACPGYPACKTTSEFEYGQDGKILPKKGEEVDDRCDECGEPLLVKVGRYGKFLACSSYPDCRFTKPYSLKIACPLEGCTGEITLRQTRSKKFFYGCSNYPKCNFAAWDEPSGQACPKCGTKYLLKKQTKEGGFLVCSDKECGYKISNEKEE